MDLPFPAHCPNGPPVFRFAPSPNGLLHRGHARSALLNAELAHRHGGRFLLRIEDIDPERSRPEHIAAVEDDLHWLGLTWEKPVRLQSRHASDYAKALTALCRKDVVYPCFCTRGQLVAKVSAAEGEGRAWPRDPDGAPLYDGACRELSKDARIEKMKAGTPHQWRLDMARALALIGAVRWQDFDPKAGTVQEHAANPLRWGDPVIARKGLGTSYHLSVVVDDALQGITHVVRGTDLEAATDVHVVLQRLLDLPTPLYWHHPLILDEEGRKLSKSKGSRTLRDEQGQGVSAAVLRDDAMRLLDQ
jgi:glutamyl-Q tRNA(Asp) synthetase